MARIGDAKSTKSNFMLDKLSKDPNTTLYAI